MARHIRLHIDELVLHGFAPGDRYRIADALHVRLAELLADAMSLDPPVTAIDLPHADGGAIQLHDGSPAAAIGEQLATALHGGLGRWLAR
jgi:hypothetical protein